MRVWSFDDDAYQVLLVSASAGGAGFTVVVAQSVGSVEDTLHVAEVVLAIGVPVLLVARSRSFPGEGGACSRVVLPLLTIDDLQDEGELDELDGVGQDGSARR